MGQVMKLTNGACEVILNVDDFEDILDKYLGSEAADYFRDFRRDRSIDEGQVEALEEQIEDLNRKIDSLEETNKDLEEEIEELQFRLSEGGQDNG